MEYKIKLTDFQNGFTLNLFHAELLASSFSSIVGSVSADYENVKFNISRYLEQNEITELNIIVSNHVAYIVTELEKRCSNLPNADDYYKERNELRLLVDTQGFDNLNTKEKEYAAKYCIADDTTIVMYYVSIGLDLDTAQAKHLVRRSEDINKAAVTCKNRAESAVVKYISIKYMAENDAATFMDAIRSFITDYGLLAHLGIEYGQSREGIMDYIEATNAYENAGLSTYTLRSGMTFENCKTEFKNYLVYGIKPTEFDFFSV